MPRLDRRARVRPGPDVVNDPARPLVLVVEDEAPQRTAMATALEARGYAVIQAATGEEALAVLAGIDPGVVILDLGLPDMDGLEVCRHLRTWQRCPVIVVSADGLEERMVAALDLGADDYVVKPFGVEVLMARVRVALRHRAATSAVVEEQRLVCGDVLVDVAAHQVVVGGRALELQAQQFSLLALLVRNEGLVVTYANLVRALWADQHPERHLDALRIAVSKLRKDLGTGPERPVIETAARVGYRLVAP